MSRILRRPMFRGGVPVSSYGTGIASGLADGGRVGFQPGGFVPIGQTQSQINAARQAINQMYGVPEAGDYKPNVRGQTGGNIFSRAMSKVRNVPLLGRMIPAGAGGVLSTYGLPALGGMAIGEAFDFYAKSTKTPEEYRRLKEMSGPNFNFDETNIDVGDVLEYIDEGGEIGEAPGFFPRGGKEKFFADKGLDPKTGLPIEKPDDSDTGTKTGTRTGTGTGTGTGTTGNQTEDPEVSAADAIRENAELFKELLGEASEEDIKKARIQDASDYALKFFEETIGKGKGAKEAAGAVAGFATGRDSRTDKAKESAKKTDQTATAIAINDYIAGKRSKEQIVEMLSKLKLSAELKKGSVNQQILDFYNKQNAFPSVSAIKRMIAGDPDLSGKQIVEFNSKELEKNNQKIEYQPGDENKVYIDSVTKEVFTYDNDGTRRSISG